MSNDTKMIVGISSGDINGIGIEIILKTFEDKRMFEFCIPVIYASNKTFSKHKKQLKINTPIQSINSIHNLIPNKINVISVWKEDVPIAFGEATKTGGKYALLSLEEAVKDLNDEKIDVLVTAPINKETIQSDSFNFPGHTEFLESKIKGEALMILMSDDLKVALMTGHIPINKVTEAITPELIYKKVILLIKTLQQDFSISKPKIAVLSINPHAGDNGVIGEDDQKILIPTIEAIRKEGALVYGPYPSDSFFGSGNYKKFDAILASYHDQGLTPFKTLSFGNGVNFTAGLERIRTSPDHGTAFDMAGKGIADISSFKEALFTAIEIYKTRKENLELNENSI
ncbi:MAG TPA: 4-hydroxythreonine-4-phosphate dehydrogenase PdxA [Lutibacter sp.]|nr:4-hydroxythreonine-4-phosphate dehydrogenase PdxA [Lutibacter sp.]